MAQKTAVITGITGQDGSYLAELLLREGYRVCGVVRRCSTSNTGRIDHLLNAKEFAGRLDLMAGDLSDSNSLVRVLSTVRPDEVYHLAAQSHVQVSFENPEYTGDVTGLGTGRLLEAIRLLKLDCRFYQASSSELYGKTTVCPQDESTPFYPRSPYGAAKAYAFYLTRNYREAYDLFAVNGILFNHESPRRGETFVTRKISLAVSKIVHGQQDCLWLGNLEARRDWGFAGDYVRGMWQMLQADQPDDFVLATGETHPVREFCEVAFEVAGLPIHWEGEQADEVGVTADGRVVVRLDPRFLRPAEVELLSGNATKARQELGWVPDVAFRGLIEMMVESDLELVRSSLR